MTTPTLAPSPLVHLPAGDRTGCRRGCRRGDEAQIEDAVELRPAQIVVDLTQCEVLSASLLRLLLTTHRRTRQRDGRPTLRGLSPRLVRIIGLSGLTEVFDVEDARAA